MKDKVITARVDRSLFQAVDAYAKTHRMTRQNVVEQALLNQLRGQNDSDVLVCSLAQQRNHIARIGGRVDVLMETLLAFVAVWFERRAPLVNDDERRQAARNLKIQYQKFIARLENTLSGNSKAMGLYSVLAECMPELASELMYTPSSERGDDNA